MRMEVTIICVTRFNFIVYKIIDKIRRCLCRNLAGGGKVLIVLARSVLVCMVIWIGRIRLILI